MKFEKINDDKIKITLSSADLEANDLDLHSFMSDSSETQSLFLSVLDKAEKDYGFITDNYQLKVETYALDNGTFMLTITRSRSKNEPERKKFKVSRKVPNMSTASLIHSRIFAILQSSYPHLSLEMWTKFQNLHCYTRIMITTI